MNVNIDGTNYFIKDDRTKYYIKKYSFIIYEVSEVKRYCSEYTVSKRNPENYYVLFDKIEYKNKILHGTFFEISSILLHDHNNIHMTEINYNRTCFYDLYYNDCSNYMLVTTDDYKEYAKWKLMF